MGSAIRANIPVQLGPFAAIYVTMTAAVNSEAGSTHHYCMGEENPHPPARIKATQQCPECGRTGWHWQKGEEVDGRVVLLSKEERDGLIDPATKDALVVSAHPLAQVLEATVPGDTVYYLEPGRAGKSRPADETGYRLLAQLLRRNPSKAIVAAFTTRSRTKLWRLQLHGEVITMQSLCWPEDLREAPQVPSGEVETEHFRLAQQLLRSVSRAFDVAEYTDHARAARAALLASRGDGAPEAAPSAVPAAGTLVDALRASVEAVQAERKQRSKSA